MSILDRSYVLAPFDELIRTCQNNVLLGLRLADKVDTFPEPTAEEALLFQVTFGRPPVELGESRAHFKRWLLLNGLKDIHQCISVALQRFIVFKTIESEAKRSAELNINVRESEIRSEMAAAHYPELVRRANQLCSQQLILQEAIESFNRARNCLEHSAGMVTKRFCNNLQKDRLTIRGRKFKLFFRRGEEETLAEIGKPGPENAALMLGAEDFEIQFAIEQPIELSLKQFVEILSTCVFLRADLEEKLTCSLR